MMKLFYIVGKHGVTSSLARWGSEIPLDLLLLKSTDRLVDTVILSFQPIAGVVGEFLPYDSTSRITEDLGRDVICVAAQTGSSLADLLLWDIAHSIPVGGKITLIDPARFDDCIYSKSYFDGVFSFSTEQHGLWFRSTWTKLTCTISEADAGLENWTFGLPVGEISEPQLDQLISDIGRLHVPQYEIVFAVSKPAPIELVQSLPAYVRVIELEGGTITQKKNLIASQAKFNNLCIFHDRVVLPINFLSAIRSFGDHYGLAGFQQLYFDPRRSELERYSDYHCDTGDVSYLIDADGAGDRGLLYTESMETRLGYRASFLEGHPAEYSRECYLTGSLYLSKKSLWLFILQNEKVEWNELEDVEFGLYATRQFGVPSRINPFAFGFTTRVRGIMIGEHDIVSRRSSASVVHLANDYVGDDRSVSGLDQTRVRALAWDCYKQFGLVEHDMDMREHIFFAPMESSQAYAHYWISLLCRLVVPRRRSKINLFVGMFATAAFGSDYDRSTKRALVNDICEGRSMVDEIVDNDYFARALENAPSLVKGAPKSAEETLRLQVMRMWRNGGEYIYPYSSFAEMMDTIWSSVGQLERLN